MLLNFGKAFKETTSMKRPSKKANNQLLAKEWALNTGKLPPGGTVWLSN